MVYSSYYVKEIQIRVGTFVSDAGYGGPVESLSVLTVDNPFLSFDEQLEAMLSNLHDVVEGEGTPVFMRFFLSDPANQAGVLKNHLSYDCPVSVIGQAPLNGTKIAALVWCRPWAKVQRTDGGLFKVSERNIDEYWFTGGVSGKEGAYSQTVSLLDELSDELESQGLTLESNCMRTWLFVNNIDLNYQDVVEGRNDVFDRHGLTPETHFIASTGIEGSTGRPHNKVMLDAVAVSGPGAMVKYLQGASHLNRTSEYGVRFERGTVIKYPDRKHVYISGTASIDNKGRILYEGDVARQTKRMIENVETLLSEAGCGFDEVGAMIIYLRDSADYAIVNEIFNAHFPDCPRVIVQAPVCRPGWLVEMECIAITRVTL